MGVQLLRHVDPTMFKFGVGVLLTVYSTSMLFARDLPQVRRGGRFADGVVGIIGGVMGGLGGLAGPAPTLWCTLRGWSKDTQRAVFQTFNLCMHTLTLAMYAASGLIKTETAVIFVLIAPAMFAPALIGVRIYSRFSETMFRRLVLLLLALSGVVLLITSGLWLTRGY